MDPYATLEIPRNATPEEIKKAYRRLAFQYHPDRHPGDKEAEEMFKKAADAYEELTNPTSPTEPIEVKGPSFGALVTSSAKRVDDRLREDEEVRERAYARFRKTIDKQAEDRTGSVRTTPPRAKPAPSKPLDLEGFLIQRYFELKENFHLDVPQPSGTMGLSDLSYLIERGGTSAFLDQENISSLEILIYVDRDLFSQHYDLQSPEVVSTTHLLQKASTMEQLVFGIIAAEGVLRECGTVFTPESGDRFQHLFKQLYNSFWPKGSNPDAGLKETANLIKHLQRYTQNTLLEQRTKEMVELAVVALDPQEDLSLAEITEKLLQIYQCLRSVHAKGEVPRNKVGERYRDYLNVEHDLRDRGYSKSELQNLRDMMWRIQGYNKNKLVLSLKGVANFLGLLAESIPKELLPLASAMVEPLKVGASSYENYHLGDTQQEWVRVFREYLPFYSRLEHNGISLYNQVMTRLESASKPLMRDMAPPLPDYASGYHITLEAAAYAGQKMTEEALTSPKPQKFLEEFGFFLKGYRQSEFYKGNRTEQKRERARVFPLTPKMTQAYSLMYKTHQTCPGGLSIKKDLMQELINIYLSPGR